MRAAWLGIRRRSLGGWVVGCSPRLEACLEEAEGEEAGEDLCWGWGPENQSSVDTPPPHPCPLPGSSPDRPGSAHGTSLPRSLASTGPLTSRPLCAHTPTAGLRREKGARYLPNLPLPFLSFLPLDWKPPLQESKETCSAPALGVKSRIFPARICLGSCSLLGYMVSRR